MRVRPLLLDPSLFTLPFDVHFARALAEEGAEPVLVGRPLRHYEHLDREPFAHEALFYRLSEGGNRNWRSSPAHRALKGAEHLLGYLRLARYIRTHDIDVVHVQWLLLPLIDQLFLRRLRRHARLFLTVHNAELTAHSVESLVGPAGALLQAAGQGGLLDLFDGFIAHTEKTLRHLERLGIPRQRMLLCPHPPLHLVGGGADRSPARSKTPLEILFFGAIKPYKGIDLLLEAALMLAARGDEFRITIAGRPFLDLAPWRARMEAAGLGERFRFDLDYVPDERLDRYLRSADLVVFPYREIDGSGALALTASYGKPIVATAIGVFAEPPVRDHVALVPADDAESLAGTLHRLIADPAARAELASKSATLAERLGDWRGYARACLEFYRQCRPDVRERQSI